VDAPLEQTAPLAEILERFLDVMDENATLNASCAFSAASLQCLESHGVEKLLARAGGLAMERRLELLGTAAHGALLPLLPPSEIERQLMLNDAANRRWFGDVYRPETVWSPFLAAAPVLAEVASDLGFSSMLVDEAGTRSWPGMWSGDRVDALTGLPGFFVLPCSRAGAQAFNHAQLSDGRELQTFVSPADRLKRSYLITALDVRPKSRAPETLMILQSVRSCRVVDLFADIPLNGTIDFIPCSSLSTAEELGKDLPFASWFRPEDPRLSAKWGLMRKLVGLLDQLHASGLGALPETTTLRETVDVAWRESWWRNPAEIDTSTRLHEAVERVSRILQPTEREALLGAMSP
jgi:hypothetical protein